MLVLAEIVSMTFEVCNSPIRQQRIRITHTHFTLCPVRDRGEEHGGGDTEGRRVKRSESGSEFRRDGRNQGRAASLLVTAAEILSTGGNRT